MIAQPHVTGHILRYFSQSSLVASFLPLSMILSFCMYFTANSFISHFNVLMDSGNGWLYALASGGILSSISQLRELKELVL